MLLTCAVHTCVAISLRLPAGNRLQKPGWLFFSFLRSVSNLHSLTVWTSLRFWNTGQFALFKHFRIRSNATFSSADFVCNQLLELIALALYSPLIHIAFNISSPLTHCTPQQGASVANSLFNDTGYILLSFIHVLVRLVLPLQDASIAWPSMKHLVNAISKLY